MRKVIFAKNLSKKYWGPACRVLLFFCLVTTVHADYLNETLKYKALGQEWLSRPIISKALENRCERIEFKTRLSMACSQLARDYYEALDIKSFSGQGMNGVVVPGTTVVFQQQLINLMGNSALQYYLKTLDVNLETYPNGFDLFQLTKRSVGVSDQKAIELIAVLFQDMTASVSHLHFIASHYRQNGMSDIEQTNFDLLKKLHRKFFEIGDLINFGELKRKDYKLYPIANHKLEYQFYHYYVMAYSALRLRQKSYNNHEAILMPLLLNMTYQTVQHRGLKDGISFPKYLNEKNIRHDMLAAYLGASYALNQAPIDSTVFLNFLQLRPLELLSSLVLTINHN